MNKNKTYPFSEKLNKIKSYGFNIKNLQIFIQ